MRVTQAELRALFDYDPRTGFFRWRHGIDLGKRAVSAGDIAGSAQRQHEKTRWMLWVNGKRIYASRAAWIYIHGDLPDNALIDHISGDTLDNRVVNLRLASAAQNTWNRLQRNGANLKLGVAKDAKGRFKARISLSTGEKFNLGTWDTEAEAHACYMGAAAILHSDFWIGRRTAAEALEYDDIAEAKRRKA